MVFRAGAGSGGLAAPAAVQATAGQTVLLADVSEWNPQVADPAYLAWSKAIAIRACYGGAHDDKAWYGGQRRDLLHSGGVAWLGIYQYLVAGQDAAGQASALVALVGKLRPGEQLICDLEEGAGDQRPRWDAWRAVIVAEYGPHAVPLLYAGPDFSAAHNLAPQWLADYRATPPAGDYLLWQFTASFSVPGVGVADCSLFRGDIGALAAHGWPARAPAKPPVKPPVVPPVKPPVVPPVTPTGWTARLPVLQLGADDAKLPQWYVHRVQAILAAVYKETGVKADGRWGPATDAAFRRFQQATGLLPVDGVCGPRSWQVLYTGS